MNTICSIIRMEVNRGVKKQKMDLVSNYKGTLKTQGFLYFRAKTQVCTGRRASFIICGRRVLLK